MFVWSSNICTYGETVACSNTFQIWISLLSLPYSWESGLVWGSICIFFSYWMQLSFFFFAMRKKSVTFLCFKGLFLWRFFWWELPMFGIPDSSDSWCPSKFLNSLFEWWEFVKLKPALWNVTFGLLNSPNFNFQNPTLCLSVCETMWGIACREFTKPPKRILRILANNQAIDVTLS